MVAAPGRSGVEAAQLLVVAARTRLEAGEAVLDALLDAGVVADVEVQEPELAEGAPVAAVEGVTLLNVDSTGHDLLALLRDDEAHAVAEALRQKLEEPLVQVLPAPRIAADRLEVDPVHGAELRLGDLVAVPALDRDPLFVEGPTFAPDLVAALAAQARQVVVEALEAIVAPVVLEPEARHPAGLDQGRALVVQAEVHVHTREIVLAADLAQCLGEEADTGGPVGAGQRQEPRARDRSERHIILSRMPNISKSFRSKPRL